MEIVSVLVSRGERLRLARGDGQMVLFEGRIPNGLVSIQTQGGGDLRQLIVEAIEGGVGYSLLLNLYAEELMYTQSI